MAYTQGMIAVVTGAGSGIGRALARQLNREGCEIFISDVKGDALEQTLQLLERKDVAAHTRILDAADKAGMHQWAEDIGNQCGHVDIVVNNAGVALMATVEESSYEDIEWLMGINFWGVVYGSKAFLPLLRKSRQGHLVNISSVFGMIGVPTQSAYNAAKFAVRGFTEALRQETAGSNVHVCCVHPGGIRTNIARDSRGGEPGQTAEDKGREFQKVARTPPETAAAKIIRAMEKRKPRLLIGWDAAIISLISRLMPVSYTRIIALMGAPKGGEQKP